MSGLSRAGFNEFQIKYLMGKAIPLADLTYLQTLQQEIEERYPAAYERYLNVKSEASVKAVTELTRQMGQQAQELSQKTVEIEMLQDRLTKAMLKITGFESGQEKLEKLLQRALPLVEQLEKARKEGTTQN